MTTHERIRAAVATGTAMIAGVTGSVINVQPADAYEYMAKSVHAYFRLIDGGRYEYWAEARITDKKGHRNYGVAASWITLDCQDWATLTWHRVAQRGEPDGYHPYTDAIRTGSITPDWSVRTCRAHASFGWINIATRNRGRGTVAANGFG